MDNPRRTLAKRGPTYPGLTPKACLRRDDSIIAAERLRGQVTESDRAKYARANSAQIVGVETADDRQSVLV